MLGKKQSIRREQDWKDAMLQIEQSVRKEELDKLIGKTVKEIRKICKGKNVEYGRKAKTQRN